MPPPKTITPRAANLSPTVQVGHVQSIGGPAAAKVVRRRASVKIPRGCRPRHAGSPLAGRAARRRRGSFAKIMGVEAVSLARFSTAGDER